MKKYIVRAVALGTSLASTASMAAIDVSAHAATITTDGGAAITVIGGAMLGLCAIAVVFKYAKASVFG